MKINFIQKFLMICSGANLHILKKTPSEWNKYSGIGGIVLFTGFFAGISAGYATYTIFDDFHAALAAGAIWGLMIFNLDRYIVSSIKKTVSWKNQLLLTLPRLVLAVFLVLSFLAVAVLLVSLVLSFLAAGLSPFMSWARSWLSCGLSLVPSLCFFRYSWMAFWLLAPMMPLLPPVS